MKVLITRAKERAREFADELIKFGLDPVFFPTIEIVEPDDWSAVDEKIMQIDKYTDIIFTSSNAVKFFIERFQKFSSIEKLHAKRIHAVGRKTMSEIQAYGLKVEPLPEKSTKESLFERILSSEDRTRRKFIFPCGNLTDKGFIESLACEIDIDAIVVYKTVMPEVDENQKKMIRQMIENGEIKVLTFFSPSSVKNFVEVFRDVDLSKQKVAVIGETTMRACSELGLKVDINPMNFESNPDAKTLAILINKEIVNDSR